MFKKASQIPGFINIPNLPTLEEPKFNDIQKPFSINEELPEGSFHWNMVYDWDPEIIKSEHDADKMQSILNEFVLCNLSTADFQFINNPIVFRLLQVLQIVIEYLSHSQTEVQTEYGDVVHQNTILRNEISKYKTKNTKLSYLVRNLKNLEKCPVCQSYFDSNLSLDCHINQKHHHVYELWSHIRDNKEYSPILEVEKLHKQIEAMRLIMKEHLKKNTEQIIAEDEKKQNETQKTQEEHNAFELSESKESDQQQQDEKYVPFKPVQQDKEKPILAFENMAPISIEPDSNKKHSTKPKNNKYCKEAVAFLNRSPPKNMRTAPTYDVIDTSNPLKLEKKNYNEISDDYRKRTGKKIRINVHDRAREVKWEHRQQKPKWIVRKKIEREIQDEVPSNAPHSMLHQLFESFNFFNSEKLEEYAKIPVVETEEEEEEEEEVSEIELTSACYSSLDYSSDRAQYYTESGGGTTKHEQQRPSLYNPGGRFMSPTERKQIRRQHRLENEEQFRKDEEIRIHNLVKLQNEEYETKVQKLKEKPAVQENPVSTKPTQKRKKKATKQTEKPNDDQTSEEKQNNKNQTIDKDEKDELNDQAMPSLSSNSAKKPRFGKPQRKKKEENNENETKEPPKEKNETKEPPKEKNEKKEPPKENDNDKEKKLENELGATNETGNKKKVKKKIKKRKDQENHERNQKEKDENDKKEEKKDDKANTKTGDDSRLVDDDPPVRQPVEKKNEFDSISWDEDESNGPKKGKKAIQAVKNENKAMKKPNKGEKPVNDGSVFDSNSWDD